MSYKFLFIFFLTIHMPLKIVAAPVGTCIQDPNASLLQTKWKKYFDLRKKRAHINSKFVISDIKMDKNTLKLLQAVSEVEELLLLVEELERKYFRQAFVDIRFNEMIAHPEFLSKLLRHEVDAEIRSSDLKFRDDEKFYQLLDLIRLEIAKTEVREAIELFRLYNLGILEKSYRLSAKASIKLLRRNGGSLEAVRGWQSDPPYLRNVILPSLKLGPFASRYRAFVSYSVGEFVVNRQPSLTEAQKVFPKIKEEEVLAMNSALPPTESNSFDDHIATLNPSPANAIDGVARTLWGEATSCQLQGLPQFEAIGRIIADRSLAVDRAVKEQSQFENRSSEIRKQNWIAVLKNWVGINRPAPGLKNKPINHLRGLSDFGRKEKISIHPAAQVISKKGQFSVWNSFTVKRFHSGQLHRNIPDGAYEIQGPQSENDDRALVRILCPQFQTEEQRNLWKQAVSLAEEIVLTPQVLAQRIVWPVPDALKNEVLFYTHEAPLPFAKEIQVPYLLIDNQRRALRGKGRGPCHHFRLFVAKAKNQY